MRNIKTVSIFVICIIILSGLIYIMCGWNKTRLERDKFRKGTFAAYCNFRVTNPSSKIYFNEEDGGIDYIYMIDSIGQPQGEWHRTDDDILYYHFLEPNSELKAHMAIEYMKRQPQGTSFQMDQLTLIGEEVAEYQLEEFFINYLYIYPQNEQTVLKAIELSSDNKVKSMVFYNNFGMVLSTKFNPWGNYYNAPELVREYMKELDCAYEEASQILSTHFQKACKELQDGVLIMGKSPLLIE
jgi:hypothetical protein